MFGPLPLPAIPQIDFTPAQRQAALALTKRSIGAQRRQGLTTGEIDRARKYGDPQTRQRLERALGAQRTQVRNMDVELALRAIATARKAKTKPGKAPVGHR